jgi:ribosomal protein S27AE
MIIDLKLHEECPRCYDGMSVGLPCPRCKGTGMILTESGEDLMKFLKQHKKEVMEIFKEGAQ